MNLTSDNALSLPYNRTVIESTYIEIVVYDYNYTKI